MHAILISSLENFINEQKNHLQYLKQNRPWDKIEVNTTIMLIEHAQFIHTFLTLIK